MFTRFVIAFFLLALFPATASAQTQPSVMWGAYLPVVPWNMQPLYALEWQVGKGASIVNFGESWYFNGHEQGFPYNDVQAIWNHGSLPMVTWSSWDSAVQSSAGTNSPQWRSAAVASGMYDSYITAWAKGAKAYGHPFFLRFDWEMNGWWRFPWADQINGNQPGDYVRMWRHVHDIFTQVGVTNVTWVWNPNYADRRTTPFAELYPGDAYVDWTALDGYNWGTDFGNEWQTFSEVFSGSHDYGGHNSYQELLNLAPTKPIMICETATSLRGGNAAAWVTDALTVQLPTRFPNIKAVVWFDWNGGIAAYSWPIDSSLAELGAFRKAIRSDYYGWNLFGWWTSAGKIKPL